MAAEISRRRVLQGVAWAAPAIVIASAVPAAAASTDPYVLAVLGASARRVASNSGPFQLEVQAAVAQASGDQAVSNVTMRVEFPAALIPWNSTPTLHSSSTGWTLTSQGVTGAVTAFTYSYNSALSSGVTTTLKLTATLNVYSDFAANVTFVANAGTTPPVNAPVAQATATAPAVGVPGQMMMDQVGGWSDSNHIYPQYNGPRWNGPWSPVGGEAISNLVMTLDVANTLSVPTASDVVITQAGWTLVSVTAITGATRLTFSTANPISNQSSASPQLYLRLPRNGSTGSGSIVAAASGQSLGNQVNASFAGSNTFTY